MPKLIILKNTTATDIELTTLGEVIDALGQLDASDYTAKDLRNDDTLLVAIQSGDIVVNDGQLDFDAMLSREYIANDNVSDEDGFWYGKRRRFSILWEQPGHGFIEGQVLKLDESTGLAALALADTHANSATTAVVSELIDANRFYAGLTGSSIENINPLAVEGGLPLTPGTAYFLSVTTPGQITATVPVGAGEIVKLVGLAIGTSSVMIFSYSGYENETALGTGEVARAQFGGFSRTPNTWQRTVIDSTISDPVSLTPVNGDRYIVKSPGAGDWLGLSDNIVEYVQATSMWHTIPPKTGFVTIDLAALLIIAYDGGIWKTILAPQNLFETISADTGSVTAATTTETLNVLGGTKISTSIVGNTLTIGWGNAAIADLIDVNTDGVIQDSFLKYNNSTTSWEITSLPTASPLPNIQARRTTALNNIPLSWTDITFDLTDIENDISIIDHDNTNRDRFTILDDGLYMITYYFTVDDEAQCRVRVNDVSVINGSESEGGDVTDANDNNQLIAHTFFANLTANDYVTLQIQARSSFENMFVGALFTITKMQGTKGADGAQGPAGTGTTVIVQDESTPIPNSPHDTFNFVGNGVTATDNAGVAEITIPGVIAPQLFYGHNGGTVQTLTGSFGTVNISSNVRNDAIYSISANQITINESGWYKISYSVGAEATGSTRSGMETQLELNGSLVPGSMAWAYHRTNNPGEDTATADTLVQITLGDVIRVRMRERNGNIRTMANGCRLMIEQIEKI